MQPFVIGARRSVLFPALLFLALAPRIFASENENDPLKNLKFRNIGPAVAGGRVSSVVGLPGDPETYYVGAAAGGVWKTTDGGASWADVFKQESTGSIGAVALAPSNHSVVWVGTGEGNPRNDVMDGAGVFLSPDAGKSWRFSGLADAGQITQILVDPADPLKATVAALGHVWGPNPERGVFRTADGGKTWRKVLYVDAETGCADLQMQPGNPLVMMAAMWQFRRHPWKLESGGPGSAIYRSEDGGETWKKLSKDMPKGPLGRIALAFAPSNPRHVYALIEAKDGMLWDSENLGDDWNRVSDNHALDVRPFYFSRFSVAPDDERHLYFNSFQLMESTDGGKTAHSLDHHVHPDHHALWIDPGNPRRMIQGNDGGVYLTSDGGRTWRYCDNIPIGQFYMVAADSSVPYNLCGGLQDNNAWCGASNSVNRIGVTGADWWTVTGGDGEYAVPAPSNPDLIYGESQNGEIFRFDRRTKLARFIRPVLEGVEEMRAADLKYRFNWTTPIAVSAKEANTVFLGGNVVFKSTDGGENWTAISGDLTRNDKSKQEVSGGEINADISGAETYDTILTVTLAPSDENVVWTGSDDGLVHVTRDGGKSWTDVTKNISGAPAWARVYQIGVSASDPGTAYVAFDAHEIDDRRAYAYATTDFGRTWRSISRGLPETPVIVIREDPHRKGFLVAGAATGLFTSADAGRTWEKVGANFPTVPVFDVKFVGEDLVVATHGRGIFVLDDLAPLAEIASARRDELHVLDSAPGRLWHFWSSRGFSYAGYAAPNPPNGAVLDYVLEKEIEVTPEQKKKHEGPVEIVITDSKGRFVARAYGPSQKGLNRFVWDMRYEGPTKLAFEKPAESELMELFNRGAGPHVLAGTYTAAVTVEGRSEKATLEVRDDPRFHVDPAVFRAQTETALAVRNEVSALNEMLNRLTAWQESLTGFDHSLARNTEEEKARRAKYADVLALGKDLGKKLAALKDSVYNSKVQTDAAEDDIHYLRTLHDDFEGLTFGLSFAYDQPPTALALGRHDELKKKLEAKIAELNGLLAGDVASYNKAAFSKGAPTLYAGDPLKVEAPAL